MPVVESALTEEWLVAAGCVFLLWAFGIRRGDRNEECCASGSSFA
jgi:hypothetical protein